MRSFLLIVSTICIVALGFGIYWMMEGAGGSSPAEVKPVRPGVEARLPGPSSAPVQGVEQVWMDRYDPKSGQRTSRMRVSRYEPQKDGSVLVSDPEVEFFLKGGRVLRLIGKTGRITTQEGISRGRNVPGAAAMQQVPRSGSLHDVKLLMLESVEAAEPTLTMTMNNAWFDNEAFKIYTEAYVDEKGQTIPGDKVPVIVVGRDYEFEGRGLRLQYNEVERRLDLLRVEHGKRLLVKNARGFRPARETERAGPATAPVAAGGQLGSLRGPVPDLLLAAADRASALGALPPTTRTTRKRPAAAPASRPATVEPVYRAIFKDAVEVFQGGQKLATADEMHIDYLGEEGEWDTGLAPAASTQPGAAPPAPVAAVKEPAKPRMPSGPRPTTRPARPLARKAPPTRPATEGEEPIEILWKGPLTIVPMPGDRPERIAPGESIVKLIARNGQAVEVTRRTEQGMHRLRCGSLTHWTIDQGVLLEEGPGVAVEMWDWRQTHLTTRTMSIAQQEGTAQLFGKSKARLPLPESGSAAATRPAAPKQFMDVAWSDRCTLHFDGSDPEEMTIKRADLMGDVAVLHPQLELTSQSLDLQFAQAGEGGATTQPKGSAPPLQQLRAHGKVNCTVSGPGGAEDSRSIACDDLTLLTDHGPDGKLYARNLVAIGNVRAMDPERDLKAGYLWVALAPPTAARAATRPAQAQTPFAPGQLQRMSAHGNVEVTMADGKKASAAELIIDREDGQRTQVKLMGRPAVVQREQDSLTGELIALVPETQELMVAGAGALKGSRQNEGQKKSLPVEVSWTRSLRGQGDRMECEGDVVAKTTDADGTINTAKGQRVILATTRPATHPATRPALAKKTSSTRPSSDLDVMANRQIQSIVLEGGPSNAELESRLENSAGLVSLFFVKSTSIQFFQNAAQAKRLVIPAPGNLLLVDNRAPATRPAAQEAAQDPMSMRGKAAFQWEKSLIYDESTRQMEMLGNVAVRRIDQGEKVDLLLTGEKIVAEIEPAATTQPSQAASSGKVADLGTKVELRKVRAEGNVRVTGNKLNVEAEVLEYDPVRHLLTARGTERKRVRQLDERGLEQASFDEVVFDTQTLNVVWSKEPQFRSNK